MRYLIVIVAVAAVAITAAVFLFEDDAQSVRSSLAVADALSADTSGYARADRPRAFDFPADHGPHPDFRTEWWYYTGNLSAASGRRFGYQLTIFRTALQPSTLSQADGEDVTWSTRQLYMGHLAVSDIESETFRSFERFSRGAGALAGATAQPFRVWLEDWEISGATADSVRLVAREEGTAIDLQLRRAKPIVFQGEDGLDQKGPEPGNASYYYSMTRMPTSGEVVIGEATYAVQGTSWLDREWSTSALGENQVGWDWFSLQLDDGRDLMFYRLRRRDGSSSPFSNGVIVDVDGAVTRLSVDDVSLKPGRFWESDVTGNRYPVSWSLRIPSRSIELEIEPFIDNQELNLAVTYWEGAVRVSGSATGTGFVEMTGYGDSEP